MASSRYFLKVGEIKGEATEPAHRSWIEVTGVFNRIEGRWTLVSLSKDTDNASPGLHVMATTGKPAPAILDYVKDGGVFLRLEMSVALVTAIQHSSTGKYPQDHLTLQSEKVVWTKTPGTPPP